MADILPKRIRSLPRRWKQGILIAADMGSLGFCVWLSFALRLDVWALPRSWADLALIAAGPVIAIPVFIRLGLYRSVVRYLPEKALLTIIQAMGIAAVLWLAAAYLSSLTFEITVPRSVPVIYWALGSIVVLSSRFAAKALLSAGGRTRTGNKIPIVIFGAGESGARLAGALRTSHDVVGFLDDDPALQGLSVLGIRVYPPSAIGDLVEEYDIRQVVIAIRSLPTPRRREIVHSMVEHKLAVKVVPAAIDLLGQKFSASQLHEIEIDDLLGRSSVPPDPALIAPMIGERTIMVTGAGGSIGSELCRKIATWNPRKLVLFEANEFALYSIERELSGRKDVDIIPVLGSVTDERRVRATLSHHNIDVVFHAAAHKHVPLVEANTLEGIQNNVLGTRRLAEIALAEGVEDFVLISTDKAVRPTNVMGATKRWAELIVRDIADRATASGSGQRFCVVRFGNVLGSNGSVVPLFKEQIARGGPITLTDARMTRYFMSIQEAAELIVQAGSICKGGDVFLLDMGDPILIADLAENMVKLAGMTVKSADNPNGDIAIVEVGSRPGEKLYEELFYDESAAMGTVHSKIMRAPCRPVDPASLRSAMERLEAHLEEGDEASARDALFTLIREREQALAG